MFPEIGDTSTMDAAELSATWLFRLGIFGAVSEMVANQDSAPPELRDVEKEVAGESGVNLAARRRK